MSLAGCASNSNPNNNNNKPTPTNGTLSVVISDASAEDWAAIDVKVMSIALTPQGGGTPVTVYTAPSTAPMFNLVELDQLGELLGNVSVTPGTYTSATLTLSANPGDVDLLVSADPETLASATRSGMSRRMRTIGRRCGPICCRPLCRWEPLLPHSR